jgi:DNA-binding beta-propeller fold protein YncE
MGAPAGLAILLLAYATLAKAQAGEPLRLEKTVELPEVQGRIDHMSLDVSGQRLFVAALGNHTVEVIDLKAGKRIHTIPGLGEPQGVLYVPANGHLYVASSKDGTVKIFDGTSFQLLKTMEYGDDADNLRYDSAHERVYVGYGSGGLGELNLEGQKLKEIPLGSHPESFQLEKDSSRIYVNLPKARKIGLVDRETHSVSGHWSMGLSLANYAMTLDEADHRLFVVTRFPARLHVIDTGSGKTIEALPAVGDCDDVFYDSVRKRIYAIGGEGAISVFGQEEANRYREMVRMPTVKGARTGFFSPDLERLYVAVRRQGSTPAMIRIFDVRERKE